MHSTVSLVSSVIILLFCDVKSILITIYQLLPDKAPVAVMIMLSSLQLSHSDGALGLFQIVYTFYDGR